MIILFLEALIELSNSMAPYILFGLFFAGILHELVPDTLVTKHLGSETIGSVIKSTLFGIPLPVCSCGVIPLASSIKKSGASKGATLSFLISTPITGIDSILATYGMFGWAFTLYRALTSMVIAMVAGILTNIFDKEIPLHEKPHQSTFTILNMPPQQTQSFTPTTQESSCCSSGGCCDSADENSKFSLSKAMKYAFITLLGDIAKPLMIGLLLGALITVLIPEDLSTLLLDHAWLSYLIAITIAVPMYVCATASLPIAAALMLSGVSAGAAFVFLSAGPATNTVTIGVVKKMLGTRTLYIYLGTIIVGSILFGLGLDYIFDINSIDITSMIHIEKDATVLEIGSSVVMWVMMLYFIIKSYLKK